MIYCEGKNCSRKDFCAYHEHFEYKYPRQLLDLSREGSHWEEHGKTYHHYSCGDKSKYYSSYRALGYREDEEYKNSLGFKYDEVCVSCEHVSLCFLLLELAGDVTHSGKRVMPNCEYIKENSEERWEKVNKVFRRESNEQ